MSLCFTKLDLEFQGYVDANLADNANSRKSTIRLWLYGFLKELHKENKKGTLYSDNQNVLFLEKNLAFHFITKHIKIRYHFI